jgi:bifunctional oligoribonuclease and PAP phosphatase NrnA
MEDKPKQQAINYILRSESILIVTHEKIDGDGLGSGLALYKALNKLKKKVSFISFDKIPDSLKFLPNCDIVSSEVPVGKDFLISLDCADIEVDKLRYNKIDNRLNILITPKSGTFTKEDVSFRRGQSKFDLIIALDCGDINQIGKLKKENIDLFYDNIVINIDHHISNDHFGKINFVDPTATSTAEIVLSLLDAMQSQIDNNIKLMDSDIATCLLTGITVDTNSFQNQNTSPKAFSVSAQLLAAGAKQQEIIKNIYKTHDLSTLKLWGRALSNLKYDSDAKIVWTIINKADFENSKAEEYQVEGLMDELITSAPGSEIALLIREIGNDIFKASLRSLHNAVDVNEIAKIFKGGGHKKAAGFKIQADSVEKMENFVLKKLFEYQLNRFDKMAGYNSVEMEEDEIMKVPEDIVTREFVKKVREQAKIEEVGVEQISTKKENVEAEQISTEEENVEVEQSSTKEEEKMTNKEEILNEEDLISEFEEEENRMNEEKNVEVEQSFTKEEEKMTNKEEILNEEDLIGEFEEEENRMNEEKNVEVEQVSTKEEEKMTNKEEIGKIHNPSNENLNRMSIERLNPEEYKGKIEEKEEKKDESLEFDISKLTINRKSVEEETKKEYINQKVEEEFNPSSLSINREIKIEDQNEELLPTVIPDEEEKSINIEEQKIEESIPVEVEQSSTKEEDVEVEQSPTKEEDEIINYKLQITTEDQIENTDDNNDKPKGSGFTQGLNLRIKD